MLDTDEEERAAKETYVTPTLTIYGSFSGSTASGSGNMAENNAGMGMGAGSPQPNRRI
jgi:hypothetical protein